MQYQEQHEEFKRLAIQKGIAQMEDILAAMPFGTTVPRRILDRWLDRIVRVPQEFSSQRRYVNRFKLGADPEFIFVHDETRRNASLFPGMQQGLAYGLDNNGRLVEIRPYPSRSALDVVASILVTLRWMAIMIPETLAYQWQAGAFLQGDGLGGHVHFGRKRPGRDLEVKALDEIDEQLLAIGAYPFKEAMRRRQGDNHRQLYGLPGDIRKQIHGYEYRTFPSWLDSPELAFLTITLSKLAVQNPHLVQGYAPLGGPAAIQRIKNLLAYYKDMDDDARLALMMVTRQFPAHAGGDFKVRWGIPALLPLPAPLRLSFVPSSMRPTSEDVQELHEYLAGRRRLGWTPPAITWSPANPPADYRMAIDTVQTAGAKGLGELLYDVCMHRTMEWTVVSTRELNRGGAWFMIPRRLAARLPVGWQAATEGKICAGSNDAIFSLESARTPDLLPKAKRLLTETVLPFWKLKDVQPDSNAKWQASLRRTPSTKYAGSVLYGSMRDFKFAMEE